ncbi:hypothetical protein THAOC_08653, partial [Thalassiosira oceanica]
SALEVAQPSSSQQRESVEKPLDAEKRRRQIDKHDNSDMIHSSTCFILAIGGSIQAVASFSRSPLPMIPSHQCQLDDATTFYRLRRARGHDVTYKLRARGFDDVEEDDDDDRELVFAGRRSFRERDEGETSFARESRSSSRSTYQSNVEFFDLDDDEDNDFFDDDDDDFEDALLDDTTYNGIIPNPLLDSIDPDGVYERLGPELFSDWTFWRDLILFAAFMTLFDNDTHLYGRFDSVIEGLERLPPDFIPTP